MKEFELLLLAYVVGALLTPTSPPKNLYLGTDTPYVYKKTYYTPPPEGYKAFYINHLGRHGARYMTSSKAVNHLKTVLEDAAAQDSLTDQGKKLKAQLEAFAAAESGNYGLLTPFGFEMEKGIAKRMYEDFPEVFGRRVQAVCTYVERTKQSMLAFLQELGNYTSMKKFHASSNGKVDPLLRFFDLNTDYVAYKKEGKWHEEVKAYEARKAYAFKLLEPLFTATYFATLMDKKELATDLYSCYTNQYDLPDQENLGSYFTEEALHYYWENKNLSEYLEKGPSNVGQWLPTNIAFALLGDFLTTSDQAIKKKDISANLRFAHAETVIPFASLLGIKGCATQTDTPSKVAQVWQDQRVAPMAANMWWVFYEHPKTKDILIKMLYNEHEVALPIEGTSGPYYKWEDVKKHYVHVLQGLDIHWKKNIVDTVKDYTVKKGATS